MKNVDKVIALLKRAKKMTVTEMAVSLEMDQPVISHALNIVRTLGLVNYERRGKNIYYSLNNNSMQLLKEYTEQFHFIEDEYFRKALMYG